MLGQIEVSEVGQTNQEQYFSLETTVPFSELSASPAHRDACPGAQGKEDSRGCCVHTHQVTQLRLQVKH